MLLFDKIIDARGLNAKSKASFLSPDYLMNHDPFLLPDMHKAVDRLCLARKNQEHITIYGDYDIDGLTATTVLMDAFTSFGFKNIDVFIPSRFTDGYGVTSEAIDKISANGANLIVTVDCGSLSESEIIKAKKLNIDVIVTDHHSVAAIQPPAVAVINPKRIDNEYPFRDLASVGIAFKLVQALQTRLKGLPKDQEKWLLDLVALGTVCDIVPLIDENRTLVYWGLKVLAKERRIGLKALMLVAGINHGNVTTRSLGFGLGPRMNAAGRLETAQYALDLLTTRDSIVALEKAQQLDELNKSRRIDQSKILKAAIIQSEKYQTDPVLVVSGADWNHGIIGIVAAKLLEKYKKPAFVLQEIGDESKGSARSFGDFNAVEAIRFCDDIITKGGGHSLAAGITLPTKNINEFRARINEFYKKQKLTNQDLLLLPKADTNAELNELTEELVDLINQLEPFGNGNTQPILKSDNLTVINVRKMGDDGQHIKLELQDLTGKTMQFLAFGAPDYFFVEIGDKLSVWYHLDVNEWQGNKTVEGKLLHLEVTE